MHLQYYSPLISFIFLLLPLALSSNFIAKTGCPGRCGSLPIPFPFGVGSSCSLGPSFNIICNTSTNPPKAYLDIHISTVQVIEINQSSVRVKHPTLALSCHDSFKNLTAYFNSVSDLSTTQYTYSDENWLTAIGCDDMVSVQAIAIGDGEARQSLGGGCTSVCENRNYSGAIFGSCSDNGNGYKLGNGCCRTPIPRGTSELIVAISDVHLDYMRNNKLFPCSNAFLAEKKSGFTYPLYYLDNATAFLTDEYLTNDFVVAPSVPPVVLDWRIGTENCSQARRNSVTFVCQNNSDCVDFGASMNGGDRVQNNSDSVDFSASVGGYLCRCWQGYDGNPYLTGRGGCRDVDECAQNMHTCVANAFCTNTLGSFKCSCQRGYHGDGMLNGTGCNRPLPQSKMISVSIGLGFGLGFPLLLSLCFWLRKLLQKRKNRKNKENFFAHLLQQQSNDGTFDKTKLFSAKELEKASDHFNESRILGQGGQGTVYKGMLSDGKIVAIKKSKLVDEDQFEQFINEVAILSQINHRNVVKLWGCCLATKVPMLVYEFVPNGTLFDLLHDPNSKSSISWNMRLEIAADIAGAVAYLHSASSIPIYHRDIKSSNILLDEKYIIKVSDFGISRSTSVEQTHLTTLVKGTFGYFDPEYFQSSRYTEKSDVYSFGVVLVELLTGQRPISLSITEELEERSLSARFLASMEANNLDLILDAQVSEQGRKEEVIAVARLAQRCLHSKGKMRHTMKEVATELESLRICEKSSIVKDESEEIIVSEDKPTMISDIEHPWTTSGISENSSSPDIQPLMLETV